jgi:cyclophilin family peptidyl-prolyl cis-trans isomerase
MYNDDSKMTYAIIAILVVVLAGIAFYLRSNSVPVKANVEVATETKIVDTKKLNQTASTTNATGTTSQVVSTTTNATTSMETVGPERIVVKNAVIKTNLGDIEFEFKIDSAKNTVTNFVTLAATNFYDGIRFHRVIKGFMIQVGDPLSKDLSKKNTWGTGGPGYTFPDELSGKETYPRGTVAMANAGPNTNGSQFFIVTVENAPLPPAYTVFGKVVKGMDVAMKIEGVKTDSRDAPIDEVVIKSVVIK